MLLIFICLVIWLISKGGESRRKRQREIDWERQAKASREWAKENDRTFEERQKKWLADHPEVLEEEQSKRSRTVHVHIHKHEHLHVKELHSDEINGMEIKELHLHK